MRVTGIIKAQRWRNVDGRTASVYGAVPYTTTAEAEGWSIEITGWTWQNSNGTIGLGRVPAKTYEEAVEIMNKVNAR